MSEQYPEVKEANQSLGVAINPTPYDWQKERIIMELIKLQPHKVADQVISDATKYINFITKKDHN